MGNSFQKVGKLIKFVKHVIEKFVRNLNRKFKDYYPTEKLGVS